MRFGHVIILAIRNLLYMWKTFKDFSIFFFQLTKIIFIMVAYVVLIVVNNSNVMVSKYVRRCRSKVEPNS